jgi:hypothetical protein
LAFAGIAGDRVSEGTSVTLAFLQSLIDLLTGSVWTYRSCSGSAWATRSSRLPSETAVIVTGSRLRAVSCRSSGDRLAAAGAFVGDNLCYAAGDGSARRR